MSSDPWRVSYCRPCDFARNHPFRWRRSGGFIEDLELADHLYEIFEDHRFEPGPHRAFLSE